VIYSLFRNYFLKLLRYSKSIKPQTLTIPSQLRGQKQIIGTAGGVKIIPIISLLVKPREIIHTFCEELGV
jgi:hypothetical protein